MAVRIERISAIAPHGLAKGTSRSRDKAEIARHDPPAGIYDGGTRMKTQTGDENPAKVYPVQIYDLVVDLKIRRHGLSICASHVVL